MKITTWNCNGALRKKFGALEKLQSDIYLVQECENPVLTKNSKYQEWSNNHLWIGDNTNKGIGIFGRTEIDLVQLDWSNTYKDHTVKYFLPCRVNDQFNLINVWAHRNNSPNFGYIGQLWKYLQTNRDKFNNLILTGDLNSNTIWDQWDRWWNHSDIVLELSELGIESLYHQFFDEEQGQESQPTFYLQRKLEKPYHIDYAFASESIAERLVKIEIGSVSKWLEVSDHLPLTFELSQTSKHSISE
ncbi:MAG: hypothetical protein RLN83_11830 [Balneola sp.]